MDHFAGQTAASPWTPSTPSFRPSFNADDLSVYTPSYGAPASPLSSNTRFSLTSELDNHSATAPLLSATRLRGRVLELAVDKEGSRVLQRLVGEAAPLSSVIDDVLAELVPALARVMCDTYGNYMCQQLFQVLTLSQRLLCWQALNPDFVTAASSRLLIQQLATPSPFLQVALDRRGTHALQALVSRASTEAEFRAMRALLAPHVLRLGVDQHGTHVVQAMLEVAASVSRGGGLSSRQTRLPDGGLVDEVFAEVVAHLRELGTSQFGLGLVKRCISKAGHVATAEEKLGVKIEQNMHMLIEDAYGNYAVQHWLETFPSNGGGGALAGGGSGSGTGTGRAVSKKLVQRISEKVVSYACHKYASNVAEMAIKVAEPQMRWKLVGQFGAREEPEFYKNLVKSPFAVFVIATALKHGHDDRQARRLVEKFAKFAEASPDGKTRTKWLKTLAPYLASDVSCGASFGHYCGPAEAAATRLPPPSNSHASAFAWFLPPEVSYENEEAPLAKDAQSVASRCFR